MSCIGIGRNRQYSIGVKHKDVCDCVVCVICVIGVLIWFFAYFCVYLYVFVCRCVDILFYFTALIHFFFFSIDTLNNSINKKQDNKGKEKYNSNCNNNNNEKEYYDNENSNMNSNISYNSDISNNSKNSYGTNNTNNSNNNINYNTNNNTGNNTKSFTTANKNRKKNTGFSQADRLATKGMNESELKNYKWVEATSITISTWNICIICIKTLIIICMCSYLLLPL